ncbi:hypothetical protein F4821DRAFT_260765 [Hypoxylon rubiginosum]|uniref:Uncharacterized protein n=1 Tax=Hypoxylon rubiginosum TaxID=110542 RepID=A0ACC0CZV8_9PEZI|nr:hypothetical protein F4821DRAFT_260765 [Hypoxylon rubiginosum]
MSTSTEKRCAHCGKEGSKRCLGCLGAPEHQLGDAGETVYCSKDCQEKGRAKHKYRCKKLQRRIVLFRVGRLLKATVLAYREVLFPINIKAVESRAMEPCPIQLWLADESHCNGRSPICCGELRDEQFLLPGRAH